MSGHQWSFHHFLPTCGQIGIRDKPKAMGTVVKGNSFRRCQNTKWIKHLVRIFLTFQIHKAASESIPEWFQLVASTTFRRNQEARKITSEVPEAIAGQTVTLGNYSEPVG